MRKVVGISVAVALFVGAILFGTITARGYWIAVAQSYVPYVGAPNIYEASREELIALDCCDYSRTFGRIENAKDAVDVAEKVILDIYGHSECPYAVKFNAAANAWIVSGSKPFWKLGGVATIAIDSETGQILMLSHTK